MEKLNFNTIFVCEFVSGGGYNKNEIPQSLFSEGFAMLRSLIDDLKSLNFDVITLLDWRIEFLSTLINTDVKVIVKKGDHFIKKYKEMLNLADAVFLIAPEFNNILYNLTKIAHQLNKKILSSNLASIEIGTSKLKTYEFFKQLNLPTPQTFALSIKGEESLIRNYQELKKPIIVKPVDGAGGEYVFLLQNEGELNAFIRNFHNLEKKREFLMQEYVPGDHLSVSLITKINKMRATILSINLQHINLLSSEGDSIYLGGQVPAPHHQEITNLIEKQLDKVDFSKFSGYLGLDFILSKDNKISLIELNPRLTTSYVGIRNSLNSNPLEFIINSNLENANFKGTSEFFHQNLIYKGTSHQINDDFLIGLSRDIPELLTPPINLHRRQKGSVKFSCFIATQEKDIQASKNKVVKIKKKLEKYNFEISTKKLIG
jgi:predicted ATP-grasp superfamily ATP-dependent carboligase